MSTPNQPTGDTIVSLLGHTLVPPAGSPTAHHNLTVAQKAFDTDPSLENTVWLGRRLAYLNRYNDAFAAYAEGMTRFPDSHELYRHRGHRYISTRQFDKAIADFETAARLSDGKPVVVEPDGMPNRLNQPTSNSHFNIYYHLGLAYYLTGAFEQALQAYEQCLTYCLNDDSLTATTDWYYMTYRRLGNEAAANALLDRITDKTSVIESPSYLNRLGMYKGERSPESLLAPTEDTPEATAIALATQGYGVANYYYYNGRTAEATALFEKIVAGSSWAAFGFIAAEVELVRLRS